MPLDIDALNAWIKGLAELTFPIAIATYLLFRVNKTLEAMRLKLVTLTIEAKVGFAVIMNKLDAKEEYERELELALARTKNTKAGDGNDG